MTTRDAGLTQEQVEAAEVHAAGSSHCGEIKSKSASSRDSTSTADLLTKQPSSHKQTPQKVPQSKKCRKVQSARSPWTVAASGEIANCQLSAHNNNKTRQEIKPRAALKLKSRKLPEGARFAHGARRFAFVPPTTHDS
jgi:hypothetical protein